MRPSDQGIKRGLARFAYGAYGMYGMYGCMVCMVWLFNLRVGSSGSVSFIHPSAQERSAGPGTDLLDLARCETPGRRHLFV
jgi:hypothetical protein